VTAHRARATLSVLLPLLVSLMLPALPALPALPVSAADPPSASATAVAMPPTTADTPTPAPGAYSPAIWHSPDANRLKYGIAGHMWWLDAHLDEFIAYYHQLGITNVRLSIDWKRFEAQQGQYDFAQFDRVLNRLAAENIEVLGSFVTEPPWAATDPARCAQAQATPDREPHDCAINPAFEPQFRAAVRAVATRYPSIRLWEFWNEPELWDGMGHEVGDYLRWLKPFYEEMHAVNPGSVVAANTLAGAFYIDWLYGASDSTNGPAKRPWDAISYHPYGALMKSGPDGKTTGIIPGPIEDVRKRMVDAGDANKKLWITEYGWETDAESASRYLTQGFQWLLAQDYIEVANLHMLHDWNGEHYGLLTTVPPIYHTGNDITAQTKFVPKEPYFSTYRNLAKPVAASVPGASGMRVFAQTGHTVQSEFRVAWEGAGGMATLGLPRTAEYPRRDPGSGLFFRAQDFERGRLIVRVAANGQPARVDLDTITDSTLSARGLFDPAVSAAPVDIAPPFRAVWQRVGGMAFLGVPRTGIVTESGVSVQYFARGRLEQRGGSVVLGLVGNEALAIQGWLDTSGNGASGTPAAREWAG